MPAYCEIKDLGRFGVNAEAMARLSVEEHKQPPIDAQADYINSFLRSRFTLPLLTWGGDLRECNAVLAAWDAIRVRGLEPDEPLDENVLLRERDRWDAWLKMVADGKVTPVVQDSSPVATPTSAFKTPRVFSNEQRGYQSDGGSDRLSFQGRRR